MDVIIIDYWFRFVCRNYRHRVTDEATAESVTIFITDMLVAEMGWDEDEAATEAWYVVRDAFKAIESETRFNS